MNPFLQTLGDALPVVVGVLAVFVVFTAARWTAAAVEWVLDRIANLVGRR